MLLAASVAEARKRVVVSSPTWAEIPGEAKVAAGWESTRLAGVQSAAVSAL